MNPCRANLGGWVIVHMAVLLALGATDSKACMAHHRSADRLVADSPLIVVGSVEAIEELPQQQEWGRDKPGPSEAEVRVLEVLKGDYTGKTLKVLSGPLGSCAPFPVHYQFQKNWTGIFLLTRYPHDGRSRLEYGGSLRSLTDRSMLESRMARARMFRDKFLDSVRAGSPSVYRTAKQLAGQLRRDGRTWPTYSVDTDHVYSVARKALERELRQVPIEVLRAAQAFDWPCERKQCWWRQEFWDNVLWDLGVSRKKELEASAITRLREKLTRLGVKPRSVENYLGGFKPYYPALTFPDGLVGLGRTRDPDLLTTQFMLGFHGYDRGGLFASYAMRFEDLARLDPVRVKRIIPALYGSDDGNLKRLARIAIGTIPGTHFVELVFDRIMASDPEAWSALENADHAQETRSRLNALLHLADTRLEPQAHAHFWSQLEGGHCFAPPMVDKSKALLQDLERNPDPDGKPDQLEAALRRYLTAVRKHKKVCQ